MLEMAQEDYGDWQMGYGMGATEVVVSYLKVRGRGESMSSDSTDGHRW